LRKRTASITGSYVALSLAISKLLADKVIKESPLVYQLAAISCGIVDGKALLDLDYNEDSQAQADANFVLTNDGKIIEMQLTAEDKPFETEQFNQMQQLAQKAIAELCDIQMAVLKDAQMIQLKQRFEPTI